MNDLLEFTVSCITFVVCEWNNKKLATICLIHFYFYECDIILTSRMPKFKKKNFKYEHFQVSNPSGREKVTFVFFIVVM